MKVRLIEGAGVEDVESWYDVWAGDALIAHVCIDDTSRGPAFGGIRTRAYPTPRAAREDARRLARAMTRKCALAGLSAGGAKTVVPWSTAHERLGRREVFRVLGDVVEQLGGRYVCGPDVGTTEEDLDVVRSVTRYVNPATNDPGRATAAGVRAAMDAAVRYVLGRTRVEGLAVAVEGLGAVGGALAEGLLEAGARVIGTDVDRRKLDAWRERGVVACDPGDAWRVDADVYAPCALGGVLRDDRVDAMGCRIVCGSANNQLAAPEVADALAARGIVFVPDEVTSAGAVIEGVLTVLEPGIDRARVDAWIDRIGRTVETMLEAAGPGLRTLAVVEAMLEERGVNR